MAVFGHGEGKEGNSALKRLLLERHRNNYHVKRNCSVQAAHHAKPADPCKRSGARYGEQKNASSASDIQNEIGLKGFSILTLKKWKSANSNYLLRSINLLVSNCLWNKLKTPGSN